MMLSSSQEEEAEEEDEVLLEDDHYALSSDVVGDDLTTISLLENVHVDAQTIEEALSTLADDPEMTRTRDEYMLQMQDAMRTFQTLYKQSKRWQIVGDPSARLKLYISRDAHNGRYMKIKGRIRCSDPRRIIIMERDYCWVERRRTWDTQLTDITQFQEYDCRQRGTVRLVSCELQHPLCVFARRRVLGLQWDRYRSDSKTATLLFETLRNVPPVMFPCPEGDVETECFLGIHVRADERSADHCYINYIVKLPASIGRVSRFLFDHYYMRMLMRRITLYEYVMANWSHYYPNNGRVIR